MMTVGQINSFDSGKRVDKMLLNGRIVNFPKMMQAVLIAVSYFLVLCYRFGDDSVNCNIWMISQQYWTTFQAGISAIICQSADTVRKSQLMYFDISLCIIIQ